MLRITLPAALALCAVAFTATAVAVPPPSVPLPPCEVVDGVEQGACPEETFMTIDAVGPLVAGGTVNVYRDISLPPCHHLHDPTTTWSPAPCWSGIDEVRVIGCAYVDLQTGDFRTTSCGSLFSGKDGAVYDGFDFEQQRIAGGGGCARSGSFDVYSLGGPASSPTGPWSVRAPSYVGCELQYLGGRPDQLRGPTWLILRSTADGEDNDGGNGFSIVGEGYVEILGDLIDLGPAAGFRVSAIEGAVVTFENTSVHTTGSAMTFTWDFGDGTGGGGEDPSHAYDAPGVYTVTLTARDADGDESTARARVHVDFDLIVELSVPQESLQVGAPFQLEVVVRNPFDEPVTDVAPLGVRGLRFAADAFLVEGPDVPLPPTLAPKEGVGLTYQVTPQVAGNRVALGAGAEARLGSLRVTGDDEARLMVRADLEVELSTSVDSETNVGDEIEIIARITNRQVETIEGISSDRLRIVPDGMMTHVSGPLASGGEDPRVAPITLEGGESATLTWRYEATQKGVAGIVADVSGRAPGSGDLFYVSDEIRVAIEEAAIDLTDLRLSPGVPAPGDRGVIRGTVKNIGSVDVTGFDFTMTAAPKIHVLERPLRELDPSITPYIETLAPQESRDFIIPVFLTLNVGEIAHYDLSLEMTASFVIDGQEGTVSHIKEVKNGLDLTQYWTSLVSTMTRLMLDNAIDIVDGFNDWGDQSTLGGLVVGCEQGKLTALQKMGDGILEVTDILGEYSVGQRLNDDGLLIVNAVTEYLNTRSLKGMAVDLAKLEDSAAYATLDGVDTLVDWMFEVQTAYEAGDHQKVAALIAEPTTTLALGVGAEEAAASVFLKLIDSKVARETMKALMREPAPNDPFDAIAFHRANEAVLADLADLPTGVQVSGEVVARSGLTPFEHEFLQEIARENGASFFVRPRPESARVFAARGYNGKPMPIKQKSVSDIDQDWLGYPKQVDVGGNWTLGPDGKPVNLGGAPDEVDTQGLVLMKEPESPELRIKEAIESGEYEPSDPYLDLVRDRYMARKAEWEAFNAELAKLNADGGFTVRRFGEEIKTTAYLDDHGVLRLSHNNLPVYSDVDLLHIARPDGSQLDPELHDDITDAIRLAIDPQHGDTMSTSDFKSLDQAVDFATRYGNEHKRGGKGGPLLIINPDGSTVLGYVDEFQVVDTTPGSGSENFAKMSVTYEGAQTCKGR